MKRKFIEYDLPLAEISEESAREKNIRHGHPSTLHIWWARRPLAASRATAFAALIDDPGPDKREERKKIYELIKKITPWEAVKNGNSKAIKEARKMIKKQYGDTPPRVLDPFAGGGSIPLETLRLGCETYASDLNPVAVLIEKATLEWPQKFGIEVELPEEELESNKKKTAQLDLNGSKKVNLLVYLVEKWANIILEEARKEIGQFYPEETSDGLVGKNEPKHKDGWIPVGYIWARTIPCQNPTCGAEIPLIKQFWLAKKKNKKIAYRPVVDKKNKKVEFEILKGEEIKKANFNPSEGTVNRANATCLVCNQVTEANKVRKLSQEGKMSERMVVVVFHHPKESGKKYRIANKKDIEVFRKAEKHLEKKIKEWPYLESPIPNEEIPLMSGTFNVPLYGIKTWKDLFNSRQQLALMTFLGGIKESTKKTRKDIEQLMKSRSETVNIEKLAKGVTAYLGIVLSRALDYSTTFCLWVSQGGFVAHTFGRQALPMSWDFFEVNLFSGSTGCWKGASEWVLYSIRGNNWKAQAPAHITISSATKLPFSDGTLDGIFTDPPYYNSVPYADLSDFFYVWLKRILGEQFPDLFITPSTPKDEEITEMAGWDSKRYAHKDKVFFEESLSKSFQEIYRVLETYGVTVIIYAHKTTDGWETMINSLHNSGFIVTASWPIHTERSGRLRSVQSAALASSIYMVCRKAERKKVGFWREIKPKIEKKIEEKLNQFWEQGIAGGDFFISAIGPGMEEFSKYEEVQRYSGDKVSTLDLLNFIRGYCANFLTKKLLKGAGQGEIDNAAKFYLVYRYAYMNNKVPFDDARKIASAQGIDLDEFWQKGGFVKKAGANIEVLTPKTRPKIKKIENMVDAMHITAQLWEKGEKEKIPEILGKADYADKESFWQFCQAIAECYPNGSKEKQLLEGLLMGKESYIEKAESVEKQPIQEALL